MKCVCDICAIPWKVWTNASFFVCVSMCFTWAFYQKICFALDIDIHIRFLTYTFTRFYMLFAIIHQSFIFHQLFYINSNFSIQTSTNKFDINTLMFENRLRYNIHNYRKSNMYWIACWNVILDIILPHFNVIFDKLNWISNKNDDYFSSPSKYFLQLKIM